MRETSFPDDQILQWLRSEDPDTQDRGARALERRYAPPLLRYLESRCGLPHADAAEVLNQVLYRAIRRMDDLRHEAKLSGWLYRMAYSAAMDWYRRNTRERHWVSLEDAPEADVLTAQQPATTEMEEGEPGIDAARIRQAMEQLSERDQDVLTAVANGVTNDELAEYLHVTPAHARVLRHRALERIRREVERLGRANEQPTHREE